MNFRRTAWGVGLLGALALLGCGGDDTPTPDGREGEGGIVGAGGAGNDASVVGNDSSTGKAGGSATDSSMTCKKTAAMSVSGTDLTACKAGLEEAGGEAVGEDGGAGCFACLCKTCPLEAKTCIGNPFCAAVTECCRAACGCVKPAPEGGSDAPSEGGNGEASTTDGPASDGAAE